MTNPADSTLCLTPVTYIIDVLGPEIVALDAAFRRGVAEQKATVKTGIGGGTKATREEVRGEVFTGSGGGKGAFETDNGIQIRDHKNTHQTWYIFLTRTRSLSYP